MSLERHRLIITKIRRSPISFEELQDYMQIQTEITGKQLTSSLRTFQRDIDRIATLYDIEIQYNPTTGKYEIAYDGNEDYNERLMEAYEISNALDFSHSFSRHVIVEKRKPLGTENLHRLLHAIKNNYSVSFLYEKYTHNDLRRRMVNPIALKESQNRWYVLAEDHTDGRIKSFGLDRIDELEITNRKFDPIEYDAEKEYRYTFGIISGVEMKPEKIILSFTPREGRYIHSLPLHHSQKEILRNEDEWRFEYFILPTHDFIMEVLSYGADVKVLEPKSLQEQVAQKLKAAVARYQGVTVEN